MDPHCVPRDRGPDLPQVFGEEQIAFSTDAKDIDPLCELAPREPAE